MSKFFLKVSDLLLSISDSETVIIEDMTTGNVESGLPSDLAESTYIHCYVLSIDTTSCFTDDGTARDIITLHV